MHSAQLQQRFPEVYAQFFAKSQLVLSTNLDFLWTDDIAVKYGGLLIYQKMPLKMYLGLEQATRPANGKQARQENGNGAANQDDRLLLGEFSRYVPGKERGRFETSPLEINHGEAILEYLRRNFDWEGKYRVHVLVELQRGHNLSFSGPLAALLTSAVAILSGEVEPAAFAQWPTLSVQQLLAEKKTHYAYLLQHASEVLRLARGGLSTGGCAFSALTPSHYPLAFYSQASGSKDYVAFRLNEPFKLPSQVAWPIDYCLVFSGSTVSPDDVARSLPKFQEDLQEISQDLTSSLQRSSALGGQEAGFNFVAEFLREDTLWHKYRGMSQVVSTVMLHALKSLLSDGFEEKSIQELFHALNQIRNQARIFGEPIFVLNLSYYLIKSVSQKRGSSLGIGAKFFGAGRMGGSLLAAIPYRYLRKEVERVVSELQAEYDVSLDYASWQDGFGEQGVLVEQHLMAGINKQALPAGMVLVQSWRQDGGRRCDCLPLARLDEQCRASDLLVDVRRRKLFVGGRALSSKEIHSQSAAADLFCLLLASPQRSLADTDLPRSSYSQNKHDLISKVTQPLSEVFQRLTGKELPLKVSGGTTDFQVSLGDISGLSIAIVESTQSLQYG